jgi:hypothetical protein
MARRTRWVPLVMAATLGVAGCINVFWTTTGRSVTAGEIGVIASPGVSIRAHLADGSTVVFPGGARVVGGSIVGPGVWSALLSDAAVTRNSVPLDSVVGIEAFRQRVLTGRTVVVSTAATAAAGIGTLLILKALFGSCPTVYADTGAGPTLEAEGFSYAIAPLLEHRDVDRLRARPDADGILRLELRNEALETHFINHIEILSVRLDTAWRALPDHAGKLVSVGDVRTVSLARDRAGRDVRVALSAADGEVFESDARTMDRARAGDLDDWIDLETSSLPPGDTIAVVLRLRNSLLNTVLLYDGMLSGPGGADWLATDLERISTVVDLSEWYKRTMGLHAAVVDSTGKVQGAGARMNDVGPIAFRDVAVLLPRPRGNGRARVRLRFVADNWRIDQVAIAGRVARPRETKVALRSVVVPTPATGGAAVQDSSALRALRATDDRYLETHPGQRMTLEFSPPSTSGRSDSTTSYFIAWQGWYREWIRPAWLTDSTRRGRFEPGDAAVLDAMTRWRAKQRELERAFHSTRIPVR